MIDRDLERSMLTWSDYRAMQIVRERERFYGSHYYHLSSIPRDASMWPLAVRS